MDEITVIHVCAGPPACSLEGDEAVAAQIAGCVWCRRITIADDGSESETGPAHALAAFSPPKAPAVLAQRATPNSPSHPNQDVTR